MGISIRFCEADRQRFGCPEWLPLDFMSVTGREAAVMQRGFDMEGEWVSFTHPGAWRRALSGTVVTGPDGKPEMVDLVGDDGGPVLDDAGQPKRVPRRQPNWGAEIVAGWLALRRAGIRIPLGDLDFASDGVEWRTEPDDDEEGEDPPSEPDQGKDEDGSIPSTTSPP